MKLRCFGCDIEKDTEILEISPFAEEDGLVDEPIIPLFVLDVEDPQIPNDPNNDSEFRMVVVCHTCFHALDHDMWISKDNWDAINPIVPYHKLPLYDVDLSDRPELLKPLS